MKRGIDIWVYRSLVAVGCGLGWPAGGQPVFKCLEGKSVTYSNTPCEKLGLKSAGEVADRVTTFQAPVAPAAPAKKASSTVPGNEVDLPKTSATKPLNPLIEKLAK